MKKAIFSLVGILALTLTGCQDNREANMSPNEVYIVNSNLVAADVYNTGYDEAYPIGVYKSGYVNETAYADITVSDAALAWYNATNSTNLKQLPADCYTIPFGKVDFLSNQVSGLYNIIFHNEKLIALGSDLKNYVIPLQLSKSNIQINYGKQYSIVSPVVKAAYVSMGRAGEIALQVDKNTKTLLADLPVSVQFKNNWNLSIDFASEKADFDKFNTTKGGALTLLPGGAYTYASKVVMEQGKKSVINTVSIDKAKLSYAFYCLPVRITGTSMEKMVANPDAAVSYITINTLLPIPRNLWEVVGFSSESVNEGANGPAKLVLDGNIDTFWHSEWGGENATSGKDNWITFDMGQEWILGAVSITPRQNNAGAQIGYVQVSNNASGPWTYVGNFATSGKTVDQTFPVAPTACRYFRLFLPANGLDPNGKPIVSNGSKTANGMMGEVSALGGPVE